jgi:hypothetical protein
MPRSNADWMGELAEEIGPLRLRDLVIPGTHGSCTYAISRASFPSPDCPAVLGALLAFLSSPSARASVPAESLDSLTGAIMRLTRLQDRSVAEQLEAGIRYLEIQVAPRPERSWSVLNVTRMTGLPKARGKPACLVYRQQHHIAYRDVHGDVWDMHYGGWKARNLSQLTHCAPPYSALAASAGGGMLRVAYRDGNDHIRMLHAQGNWKHADLTEITGCPRAEGSPIVLDCRGEARIFFRDDAGRLWQLSEVEKRWTGLNLSELVEVPNMVGDPAAFEHDGRVSVFCRDADGAPWEITYDGRWNRQALGHAVKAPAAATAPVAIADDAGRRLYYRDLEGDIWELRREGEHWRSQDLSKLTGAAGATGNLCVLRHRHELHVIYCDASGDLCDLREDGGWAAHNLTQILGADKATGSPAAIVTRGELHVVFRDVNGDIRDLHHTSGGAWRQHNVVDAAGSPRARRDPVCAEWQGRHQVLYQGEDGSIHDLYYDASRWQTARLTRRDGRLDAVGDPAMIEYRGRQHIVFREAAGSLRELSFDHRWQQRDLLAPTAAPQPAADAALSVLGLQYHVIYRDRGDSLWQLRHDPHEGWKAFDLTRASGLPPAVGNPLSVEYHSEHHVIFRDGTGQVWDLCPAIGSGQNLTRLARAPHAAGDIAAILHEGEPRLLHRDSDGGLTEMRFEGDWKSRPVAHLTGSALAAGDPAAALFHGGAHVVYRDRAGHIRHLYEDRGWQMQDLTELARCPDAATDPVLAAEADDELHVLYRDRAGDLYDVYWAQEALYACRVMFTERVERVIAAVAEFLARHHREIVVLDFNRFYEMTERSHEALANMLRAAFGPMLVALPRARLAEVTLDELWRTGQRLLVLYDYEPATKSHPELWSNARRRRGERTADVVSAPATEAQDVHALKARLVRAIEADRKPGLLLLKGVIVPELPRSWSAWMGEAVAPQAVAHRALETVRALDREMTERDGAVPALVARWIRDEWSDRSLNIVAVDHFERSDLVDAARLVNRRHRTS